MGQLGAGLGSDYGTGVLDTTQTWANGPNAVADSNQRMDAELVNDFADAIINIETVLGTDPEGSYADVEARLDAMLPTSGTFTAGSVVFHNGTNLVEDNANLFFDDGNNRLGVGTNTPSQRLHVVGGNILVDDNSILAWGDVGTAISGNAASDFITLATAGAERIRVDSNGALFIGDTANGSQTIGLTINQAANDDEILSLKSSDVAHGFTDITETDTYGSISKLGANEGGVLILGVGESTLTSGLLLRGAAGTDVTSPGAGNAGYITLEGKKVSGTDYADSPTDAVILTLRTQIASADRSVLHVDAEGDIHVDGSGTLTTYDDFKDWQMARAIKASLFPARHELAERYADMIDKYKPILEKSGIVTYNKNTDGVPFLALKKATLFLLDAAFQTGKEVFIGHEHRLELLEKRLALLESQ